MPLWGTAHASADNKPKYLPEDENSDYTKGNAYATQSGWVRKAGTAATGSSRTAAAWNRSGGMVPRWARPHPTAPNSL